MKKYIFIAAVAFALSSCNQPVQKTKPDVKKDKPAIGAQKDEHGCLIAAGQTWGQLKKDCIQVFNTGFRLNPVDTKKDEAVISAFVIFSDDRSKIELFLPDQKNIQSVILDKTAKLLYTNGTYKYDAGKSVLYISGQEKYKGNVE